ncbi:MAG TPA: hypothetical protein VF043_19530 [Ktedonobacteraceae bacterium]
MSHYNAGVAERGKTGTSHSPLQAHVFPQETICHSAWTFFRSSSAPGFLLTKGSMTPGGGVTDTLTRTAHEDNG